MSDERLRQAAKVLRDQGESVATVVEITYGSRNSTTAYRGPTGVYHLDRQGDEYGTPRVPADWPDLTQTGEWYELMRPDVALALADLLVSMAETLEMGHLRDRATWEMADLLANKILGGAA